MVSLAIPELRLPPVTPPKNPKMKEQVQIPIPMPCLTRNRIRAEVGDHVLATRYSDGHAGDPWVIGFVQDIIQNSKGTSCSVWISHTREDGNRYRRAIKLRSQEEAKYLIDVAKKLEISYLAKSLYSVLAEYRKKRKPFLSHDPEAIDD
jgi:hypothetical protein